MKLLSVVRARSLWFFDPKELNPRGKSIYPAIINWLKEEYEFEVVPKSQTDVTPQGGLAFLRGSFEAKTSTNEFIDVELTIFNDGAMADTRSSTKDSDAFLERTLKSVAEVFDLEYDASLIRKRVYVSEVNFRSDRFLNGLNPKLQEFSSKLSDLSGQSFQTSAIILGPNPEGFKIRPTPFTFERLADSPFSENRYYSQAPFDTDRHVQLLEELEGFLF